MLRKSYSNSANPTAKIAQTHLNLRAFFRKNRVVHLLLGLSGSSSLMTEWERATVAPLNKLIWRAPLGNGESLFPVINIGNSVSTEVIKTGTSASLLSKPVLTETRMLSTGESSLLVWTYMTLKKIKYWFGYRLKVNLHRIRFSSVFLRFCFSVKKYALFHPHFISPYPH